jgi:hypothetical protein
MTRIHILIRDTTQSPVVSRFRASQGLDGAWSLRGRAPLISGCLLTVMVPANATRIAIDPVIAFSSELLIDAPPDRLRPR